MKVLYKCLFLFVLTVSSLAGWAQTLDLDKRYEEDFAAQVKSIDEFIQRFNGNESHPEISPSEDSRLNNIIALFNKSIPHDGLSEEAFKKRITDFATKAINNNVFISIENGGLLAEASSIIRIGKKETKVNLFLQMETLSNGIPRWAIVGVKGLPETGLIDSTRIGIIPPTEHEMHFLGLEEKFSHPSSGTIGYRARGHKIDFVTAFLVYIQTGAIKMEQVESLRLYCLSIPDYVFSIEEFGRKGNNSGWLISNLVAVRDREKINYLNKLIY